MVEFHYTALDAKGQQVMGNLAAADKHELAVLLQQLGLFLVSASENHSKPEAPPSDLHVHKPSTPNRPEDSEAESFGEVWSRASLAKRLILVGIALAGLLWGTRDIIFPPRYSVVPQDPVLAPLASIQENMTRSEIEKILPQRYGNSEPTRTKYFLPPGTIIEIIYNNDGGPGSPSNKKIGNTIKFQRLTTPSK